MNVKHIVNRAIGDQRQVLPLLVRISLAVAIVFLLIWVGPATVRRLQSLSAAELGEALSNSLSLGSILILISLGLAITFGVMGVINMAHGDMLMLGAYTAFVVTSPAYCDLNIFWAIPISFLVVGAFGYLLEVTMIRYLYGRPLDTLLATWGVGLILQQSVNLRFGPNLQSLHLSESLQGYVTLGGLNVPIYRLFIVGVMLLCLLLIYLWFFRTSFGLKIRAVVQNRDMAAALGISTRRVDAAAFAFATGLAGVAGCIVAYLYNVNFNMGNDYIVDAFMVVILGGMGQLSGTVAAGALIGTASSFASKLIGNEITAKVVTLLLVMGFILLRPRGLFALKERKYD